MAKKKEIIRPDEEPLKEEDLELGDMFLTDLELARLDLYQSKAQLQSEIIEKIKLKIELVDMAYRDNRAVLKNTMRGCDASQTEARTEYNNQLKEIEERLGIKMAEYAVSENGALIHQDLVK